MNWKFLLLAIGIFINPMLSMPQETGTFTDSRDGKIYKTIKIGSQTWMAENLAFKCETGCWAFNNETSNVNIYGYLYTWASAGKACPDGWHIPSDAEWNVLINFLGGAGIAGDKMKKPGTNPIADSTNSSGFTAVAGGCYNTDGLFVSDSGYGFWWSSSEYSTKDAMYKGLYFAGSEVIMQNIDKNSGLSVRCVKD